MHTIVIEDRKCKSNEKSRAFRGESQDQLGGWERRLGPVRTSKKGW